jgi:hypothetical protein
LRFRSAHENTKARYGANTRPFVRAAGTPRAIGVLTIGNASLQIGDSASNRSPPILPSSRRPESRAKCG